MSRAAAHLRFHYLSALMKRRSLALGVAHSHPLPVRNVVVDSATPRFKIAHQAKSNLVFK